MHPRQRGRGNISGRDICIAVFREDALEADQAVQEKEGEKSTFLQRRFGTERIGADTFRPLSKRRFSSLDLDLDYDYSVYHIDSEFKQLANPPTLLLFRSGLPTP